MNFLRLFWRIVRQVFHEATGALFFFFALYGGIAAWRHWHRRGDAWLLAADAAYAVTMLVLAWSCFRDSRRVR